MSCSSSSKRRGHHSDISHSDITLSAGAKPVGGKVDRTVTGSILVALTVLYCDSASQRTAGDEGFSMGDIHRAAAVNQLLSEGLCTLSALKIG